MEEMHRIAPALPCGCLGRCRQESDPELPNNIAAIARKTRIEAHCTNTHIFNVPHVLEFDASNPDSAVTI